MGGRCEVLTMLLGAFIGFAFVALLYLARHWRPARHTTEVAVWCPRRQTVRLGVRLRDGSIDCPCGTHTTTIHTTTGD
jgi:hypothetical protein